MTKLIIAAWLLAATVCTAQPHKLGKCTPRKHTPEVAWQYRYGSFSPETVTDRDHAFWRLTGWKRMSFFGRRDCEAFRAHPPCR